MIRVWLALAIVFVTWVLAANAAIYSHSFIEFVLLLIVNMLCAVAFAALLEINTTKGTAKE